jgi:hypothetical protein
MKNLKELQKVLFTGLEEGGKTSILLLLDRKFSLLPAVKPTIKAKRSFYTDSLLGIHITRWDLGGQSIYRKIYIDEKSKYFTEMQSVFYVIDIQSKKKFEEALIYLKDIINIITPNHLENFQLLILLHKFDPDIKKKEEILENQRFLKNKIKSLVGNLKYTIYTTSIYDETTLLKAFSDGIFYATHKSKMFQTLLKDYMGKTYSSATLLLDQNCLIIASRSTDVYYQKICEEIAIVTNIEFPHKKSNIHKEGIIFLRNLDISNTRFYLVALCLNKKVKTRSYEYLPLLAENLKNLLKSFE